MDKYFYIVDFEIFYRTIDRNFDPKVNFDLNKREADLLIKINNKKKRTFHFYAHHIQLRNGPSSYIVDHLIKLDLVEIKKEKSDQRRKTLLLTESGVDLAKEIARQRESFFQKELSVLSIEELEDLDKAHKLIRRLTRKLRKDKKVKT